MFFVSLYFWYSLFTRVRERVRKNDHVNLLYGRDILGARPGYMFARCEMLCSPIVTIKRAHMENSEGISEMSAR